MEDPGEGPKYAKIGDLSFLSDLPDKWRVDSVSHEYLMERYEAVLGSRLESFRNHKGPI